MTRRASPSLPTAAVVAVAFALAVLGWREFEFLTDDAFIAFRYVHNAIAGRGWVWNPAPFVPVEGYTSFLWVALLTLAWSAFGVEPPDAVGPLALMLGLGSLALAVRWLLRLPITSSTLRLSVMGVALLGIVANRTYLTWLSSGLETALFNFAFSAWVVLCFERPRSAAAARTGRTLLLALSAAASALTRPDGWLAVAGTIALIGIERWQRGRFDRREAIAFAPLLLPFAHLLWRRSFYGEWVPNTYFAKHVGMWPESGLRYAASFALEYALWGWLAVGAYWIFRSSRNLRLGERLRDPGWTGSLIAVGGLALHFLYYTLSVGGDHFEFRVYSHLIPFAFVSFPWLLLSAGVSPARTLGLLVSFVALSMPIPWAHHWATQDLTTREQTHRLFVPVAPELPAPFAWMARPFDDLQAWLIPHHVSMRHREHQAFLEFRRQRLPSRKEGAKISWADRPVLVGGNVGWLGWVLPNVAILDQAGLNDYVVARTAPPPDRERKMAHDRVANHSYLACYLPNVYESKDGIRVIPRGTPLRDDDIRRCEAQFRPIAHTLKATPRQR